MKVYVGCAIDQSATALAQYEQIIDVVKSVIKECVIFNPLTAYRINGFDNLSQSDLEYTYEVNMAALRNSDLAIFKVTSAPSFGVPIEIHECFMNDVPYIIWYDCEKSPGIYVRYYGDNKIVRDVVALKMRIEAMRQLLTAEEEADEDDYAQ